MPNSFFQLLYNLKWQDLASALVGLIIMQTILLLLKHRHRKHDTFKRMGIKGPKANLIHGHLYETRRQPYVKYAHQLHESYGKNVGIYLGADPYLLTRDLNLIQEVFVAKSRLFYNRMHFYLNVDPVPDNLICQRGDRWRYMRRLLSPAFTQSKIRSSRFYRDTWQTVAKFMLQLEANKRPVGVEQHCETAEVNQNTKQSNQQVTFVDDSYDRMAALALDVIVKTAFHMDDVVNFRGPLTSTTGRELGTERASFTRGKRVKERAARATGDAFLDTVKRACRLGFNPLVELIFCFPFLDKPLTFLCNQLYFSSILAILFRRLEQLVRAPTKEQQDQHLGSTSGEAGDLAPGARKRIIDSLIEVLRERKISPSEFTGNAFVIVFAGFETTANALTFTLWLLAQDQRVQRKLRHLLEEKFIPSQAGGRAPLESLRIINELSSKNTADISDYAQNNQLLDSELAELATDATPYLECVLNESLRLYPPVPGLSCRQASQPCSLNAGSGGRPLHIEEGVNVLPSSFSIHRDPEIWGRDALEFRPERFESLDASVLNSAQFMPFGLGPRNCIGKALAMHEMKIAIGLLVLGYSIEPWAQRTPEKLRLSSPINITLTCADKIPLKFVKLDRQHRPPPLNKTELT